MESDNVCEWKAPWAPKEIETAKRSDKRDTTTDDITTDNLWGHGGGGMAGFLDWCG